PPPPFSLNCSLPNFFNGDSDTTTTLPSNEFLDSIQPHVPHPPQGQEVDQSCQSDNTNIALFPMAPTSPQMFASQVSCDSLMSYKSPSLAQSQQLHESYLPQEQEFDQFHQSDSTNTTSTTNSNNYDFSDLNEWLLNDPAVEELSYQVQPLPTSQSQHTT